MYWKNPNKPFGQPKVILQLSFFIYFIILFFSLTWICLPCTSWPPICFLCFSPQQTPPREIRKQHVKFPVCNPTFVTQGDSGFPSPLWILGGGRRWARESVIGHGHPPKNGIPKHSPRIVFFFCILTFIHESKWSSSFTEVDWQIKLYETNLLIFGIQ